MYLEDYEDFEPDDEDLELDDDDGDLDELMEMLDDADYDDFEPDDEDLDDIERKRRFFKRRWKSKMRRSKSSFKRGRRKEDPLCNGRAGREGIPALRSQRPGHGSPDKLAET